MMFAELVAASTRAAETRSRIAKRDAIAACLRASLPDEIEIAVAFLAGLVRQGKMGVGYASLQAVRANPAATASLTLSEVDAAFAQVASTGGKGSAAARSAFLRTLFEHMTADEQDFAVRLLVGELRQGALEGIIADAIGAATDVSATIVRRAAMFTGDLAVVARAAASGGATAVAEFSIELFRPVQPMLAQPAEDVADALRKLGTAMFEWKLDGARVQVHKQGDEVRVYTRNLNDVTDSVPEVVDVVRVMPARELILDGETIALTASGAPQPFQVTMRRFGRKLEIEQLRAELPLSVYFFDCLRHETQSLVDTPMQERVDRLHTLLPASLRIPRLITADAAAAEDFYADALARGHEGLMAKSLVAPYEAGGRGGAWLKVKHAHTLDLVVLAAEWGNGRRQGWLSNLHLGARNPSSGDFVMLGKTFKGMTDQLLEWQTKALLSLERHRDSYTVHVRPELVVEVAFNDLQASPHYPGGLALRFARVKGYRPDKTPADADTIDTVRAIHAAQLAKGNSDAE